MNTPGRAAACAALTHLVLLASALAGDDTASLKDAARLALAAARSGDSARLEALAARDDPDPWLVAYELLCVGERGAAEAFARAAPRPDTKLLFRYIHSLDPAKDDALRKAVSGATAPAIDGDPERILKIVESVDPGVGVPSVQLLVLEGLALRELGNLPESVRAFRSAAAAAETLGWLSRAAHALEMGSDGARAIPDRDAELDLLTRRLAVVKARNRRVDIARALGSVGVCHWLRKERRRALDHMRQSLAIYEKLEDRAGMAWALGSLGDVHRELGQIPEAIEAKKRSYELSLEIEDLAAASMATRSVGLLHAANRDFAKAISWFEVGLELERRRKDDAGAAGCLRAIGDFYQGLGNFRKSLEYYDLARAAYVKLGRERDLAVILANSTGMHLMLGNVPEALDCAERARRLYAEQNRPEGVAMMVGNMGSIHFQLGSYHRALQCYEETLRLFEQIENRRGIATTLGNIGSVHHAIGNYARALEYMERALERREALGKRGAADALANLGVIRRALGDPKMAVEMLEQSLEAKKRERDHAGCAYVLRCMGVTQLGLSDFESAGKSFEQALKLAEQSGELEMVVLSRWGLADVHLAAGRLEQAMEQARLSIAAMHELVRGVSEGQGEAARERVAPLFEVGFKAAIRSGNVEEACFFLETGRAGALLESLGGRKKLLDHVVPERLRREEEDARAAEAVALTAYRKALHIGRRDGIRSRRQELESAREGVRSAIERIRRNSKATVVVYPKAAPLAEIQDRLRAGEVLVHYALTDERAWALVISHDGARIVELGETEKIVEACTELRAHDRKADLSDALEALGRRVIAPLGLAKGVERLLVCPHRDLSYIPFCLLVPDREICYVPSGTTYGHLVAERRRRGEGVLALGDPEYGVEPMAGTGLTRRFGERLTRLPGSRKEAVAVGTETLLGAAASEASLRKALAERSRWRAVHLACHGLLDPEQPSFSALALAPTPDHDGLLTCMDVFRLRIPADLVVLSACETARGRVFRTEGIVGLTRAFLSAGAPRVICSLWKVDDEATRALMVKFYELWLGEGLSTVEALEGAQQHVRGHEKWDHPYYWAAWVLWGPGD